MSAWTEVSDRVYQRRYQPLDVTVAVVRGASGLLLVDTRSSHREADEIRRDLRAFGDVPVRWVVNTHAHYDHCFGNFRFGPDSDIAAPIYGHDLLPAHLDDFERPRLARWIADGKEPVDEWREVVITAPTRLIAQHLTLDIGDRAVELVHLGRGHTDNDLLVHVGDADTWLVGDLLEESGPPMYGSGSFPLDWPVTVAALCERLDATTTLVPGHGAPVDANFARVQQQQLATVAALIRELHGAGVAVTEAVDAAGDRWPFPPTVLAAAVEAGYAHLRRTGIADA